jgi:hypothetical protein
MRHGFLRLGFIVDGDGTGTLYVEAEVDGYSGRSHAYFDIDEIKRFAEALSQYPLSEDKACSLTGGFGESRGNPAQEHVGIDAYPVNRRGYIGIQVRMATAVWIDTPPESRRIAQLEIVTTYEPLAKFANDILAMLSGTLPQARIEGDWEHR